MATRWAKTTGIEVERLIKGDLQVNYIEITLNSQQNTGIQLKEGEVYVVCVTLSRERFANLKLGDENTLMTYQYPILKKENQKY